MITLSATRQEPRLRDIQTRVIVPATVDAKDAVGVRFARIAFYTKGVRRDHRVRMIVTVRDLRGSLVKGATVSVSSLERGRLLRTRRPG